MEIEGENLHGETRLVANEIVAHTLKKRLNPMPSKKKIKHLQM